MATQRQNAGHNGTYYIIKVNWQNNSDRRLILMQRKHTIYMKTTRDHIREAQGYYLFTKIQDVFKYYSSDFSFIKWLMLFLSYCIDFCHYIKEIILLCLCHSDEEIILQNTCMYQTPRWRGFCGRMVDEWIWRSSLSIFPYRIYH